MIMLMALKWLSKKCSHGNLAPMNGSHPISARNNRGEGEGVSGVG